MSFCYLFFFPFDVLAAFSSLVHSVTKNVVSIISIYQIFHELIRRKWELCIQRSILCSEYYSVIPLQHRAKLTMLSEMCFSLSLSSCESLQVINVLTSHPVITSINLHSLPSSSDESIQTNSNCADKHYLNPWNIAKSMLFPRFFQPKVILRNREFFLFYAKLCWRNRLTNWYM